MKDFSRDEEYWSDCADMNLHCLFKKIISKTFSFEKYKNFNRLTNILNGIFVKNLKRGLF